MDFFLWILISVVLMILRSLPVFRGIGWCIVALFHAFCRYCIAPFTTPPSHIRYGECRNMEAFRSLQQGGYWIWPHWSSYAVGSIEQAEA